ncbi:MAG: hypothetical protein AMXMBFR16_02950 [Candidatus Uhrbacteria bacterium]
MLDQGFVGRPVELSVFQNRLVVDWDANTLQAPTNVTLNVDGDRVRISFENAEALSPSGSINITLDDKHKTVFASADISLSSADFEAVLTVQESMNEEATGADGITYTDERVFLMLDQGFVGRPVTMDAFGGAAVLAWDERALLKPTTLTLTRTRGGQEADQTEASWGLEIAFGSDDAISPAGMFTLTFKALRPPESGEQAEVRVLSSSVNTVSAAFSGEHVTMRTAAANKAVYAPAYRSGIMRYGIASWYRYKECLCAASPDVPKGTRLRVARADDPNTFTVVTVNDWGPDRSVHPDRVIDLDYVAFDRIGNPRGGVLGVVVDLVKPEDPVYALADELPPPPWKW